MRKEELAQYLSEKEGQLGLRPGELLALWAQESGRSVDPELRGPKLPRGKGQAVGPFQVVPGYHPEFPLTGDLREQADYAAKFYAGGGDSPAARARHYYGTGRAPEGQPTTAQYIQQLTSRIPEVADMSVPSQQMTLPEAAQSNNVAGALQQMLMSRITSPEQMQQQRAARQEALGGYQEALRKPAMGDYTPTQHSFYSMLGNFGPGTHPAYAALKGISAGGDMLAKQRMSGQSGDVSAAKVGYEDARDLDKSDDLLGLASLKSLAGAGKAGSPVVKMDKDGNMVVFNPATGETNVVHASQRGEYERIFLSAYKQAASEGMDQPEVYAHKLASQVLKGAPGVNPQTTALPAQSSALGAPGGVPGPQGIQQVAPVEPGPGDVLNQYISSKQMAESGGNDMSNPQVAAAVKQMAAARKELMSRFQIDPVGMTLAGPQPGMAPQEGSMPQLKYRDKPRAELNINEAGAIGKARGAEYEQIATEAKSAAGKVEAINQLEKIDPATGILTNTDAFVANFANSFGMSPDNPVIKNAIKTRSADQIMKHISNAALTEQKGVQTRSDEVRIADEFPKLTDVNQTYKLGLKLQKERALRQQEKLEFYDSRVNQKAYAGSASTDWRNQIKGDPLTQKIGGQLVMRSDYLKQFSAKFPDAEPGEALESWKHLESQWQAPRRK